jgi:hypothetical protein
MKNDRRRSRTGKPAPKTSAAERARVRDAVKRHRYRKKATDGDDLVIGTVGVRRRRTAATLERLGYQVNDKDKKEFFAAVEKAIDMVWTRPPGRRSSARIRACFNSAACCAGHPGRLSVGFWMKPAAWRFAPVCAWTCQNSSHVPAQPRAATTQTPRRPTGRWRGERSEAIRLAVRDHHTRSLCAQSPAQSEQWCCWFCYRRSIFGSEEAAAIRALQRCRSMANIGAEHC